MASCYFLLTGSHVFGGATFVEVCAGHLYKDPEPPSIRGPLGQPLQNQALQGLRQRRAHTLGLQPDTPLDATTRRRDSGTVLAFWNPGTDFRTISAFFEQFRDRNVVPLSPGE
jgi:hypothetical protein